MPCHSLWNIWKCDNEKSIEQRIAGKCVNQFGEASMFVECSTYSKFVPAFTNSLYRQNFSGKTLTNEQSQFYRSTLTYFDEVRGVRRTCVPTSLPLSSALLVFVRPDTPDIVTTSNVLIVTPAQHLLPTD